VEGLQFSPVDPIDLGNSPQSSFIPEVFFADAGNRSLSFLWFDGLFLTQHGLVAVPYAILSGRVPPVILPPSIRLSIQSYGYSWPFWVENSLVIARPSM